MALSVRCSLSCVLASALAMVGCQELQERATEALEGAQEAVASATRAEPIQQDITGSLDAADHLMDFTRGADQHYDRYSVSVSSGMVLLAEVSSEEFDPQIERPSNPVFRARRSPGPMHRDTFLEMESPDDDPTVAAAQRTISFDIMGRNAQALGAYALTYRTWYPSLVYMLPRRSSPTHTTPDAVPAVAHALAVGETAGELSADDGMLTGAATTQLPNRPLRVSALGLFDAYQFDVGAGQEVRLQVQSRDIDPHVAVVSPQGFEVGNDSGGRRATVSITAPEAGRYFAIVHDADVGDYEIRLMLR